MVYVDKAGHLISDGSLTELHEFAEKIGVKKCWFENKRGKHKPHYDLNKKKVALAISDGAILVGSKTIVTVLKNSNYGKENKAV